MLAQGDAQVRIRLVVPICCSEISSSEDVDSHDEIFLALQQLVDEGRRLFALG